jgi:hypothetical protein
MKTLIATAILGVMLISCDRDEGECIEEPCNSGIPLYLQPVCGCNDVTYSNWEEAECYGIYEYREGACDE